ncbi:LysR family transcriptional regulator [Terriglobus roseus]|nr:LysR family transcriptional regulator [Terriglobus roseus]
MNASFDNLDLRSLRMLKQLLDLKSVTKAGEALELSQPAASRVLSRLRLTLGDPLLVRGRQGNTLTPRGEELRPAVAEALRSISVLFEREVFAPSTAKLIVRIATTDHGATVVLSPLIEMLGTFAPGITLEVTPWSAQTLHELETGWLDLALDSESRLPENFHARTLYRERSVCLVRQGHPLLDGRRKDGSLDPALASAYPQIVLLYPVGDRLEGDDPLARFGHPSPRIALRTPYFASAPMMLTHTDHFIILPSRLGRVLADSAPLSQIPLRGETPFAYRLIWHERTQKDEGLGWLRAQMYRLLK